MKSLLQVIFLVLKRVSMAMLLIQLISGQGVAYILRLISSLVQKSHKMLRGVHDVVGKSRSFKTCQSFHHQKLKPSNRTLNSQIFMRCRRCLIKLYVVALANKYVLSETAACIISVHELFQQ